MRLSLIVLLANIAVVLSVAADPTSSAGPGWLIEKYFTNASSTDAVIVFGMRTGQCLAFNSYVTNDEGETFYYKYSCDNVYVQFQLYKDDACSSAVHQAEYALDFTMNFNSSYSWEFNYHRGYWYERYWYMQELAYGTFECVTSTDQYSFAANQKYAVTEFFPADAAETDEETQCTTEYTQFAAYQKDYCFELYKEFDADDDYEGYQWYRFSANDNTFISLTQFYEDTCSFSTDGWRTRNVFPVDECKENFYQYPGGDAHTKDTTNAVSTLADAPKQQQRMSLSVSNSPFTFTAQTPTLAKRVAAIEVSKFTQIPMKTHEEKKAVQEAQLKKRIAKRDAVKKARDAKKGTKGVVPIIDDDDTDGVHNPIPNRDDEYQFIYESGNVYFTDDSYYRDDDYDDDRNVLVDDDEYEFYFYYAPGIAGSKILSQYYMWKNVPALPEDTAAPAAWFTETYFAYDSENDDDDLPIITATRATLKCMPWFSGEEPMFNYQVYCSHGYANIMYYPGYDFDCSGDYVLQSQDYYTFWESSNVLGKRLYWNFADVTFECSDTMFGADTVAAAGEHSFATEFFYPLTGYNGDNDDYQSECTAAGDESTTDVVMGVSFMQDYCFSISPIDRSNDDLMSTYSMMYWVDNENNNQNIQFTVWEAAECRDKYVTQTKEVEINTCYYEQPNTVYHIDSFPVRKLAEKKTAKAAAAPKAVPKEVKDFQQHDTMSTVFNQFLVKNVPPAIKAQYHKRVAANRKAARAEKQQAAKKETASAAGVKKDESFYNDYYYYYEAGATTFNNRVTYMANQWFTIPTTPTIPPSEVPTIAPSQAPTVQPSETPTVQPSQAPSEIPTIAPTMAPNPPTLRPTPKWGNPTASPTHQVTYTFSVRQVLHGISANDFKSDDRNTEAFIAALVMAMPPLVSSNFEIADVSDVVEARRLRGLEASDSVEITYWVAYTVAETGYHDAETAYEALTTLLKTAVEDTDLFDGYISVVAAADARNAPLLLGTTTDSATPSEAAQTGTDDDSKPNTDNHHKLIVGLVVGLGGGLLLIGLIYMFVFYCSGDGESHHAAPQTIVHHSNNEKAFELTSVDPTAEKAAI